MRTNTKAVVAKQFTEEGGRAFDHMSAEQALRRSLMSCMLGEKTFYEDGVSIAERIATLADSVPIEKVAELAVEARNKHHLRHAPLWLTLNVIKRGSGAKTTGTLVADTIDSVVQRADELAEILAMYWNNGRKMVPRQMKKGLGRAFKRFNAYQLAKYDRANTVKLRDVLRVIHAKPADKEQADLWGSVINGTLPRPDTWESNLAGKADKKDTFTRLIQEGKLGYLALLRNLRGMLEAGVNEELVREAILARKGADKILPFRYIAAARAAPTFEPELDAALLASLEGTDKLAGITYVVVDVSRSMNDKLSVHSDMRRVDAACGLASMIQCEQLKLYSFSDALVEVPPRKGMAGVDVIMKSQQHRGTYLVKTLTELKNKVTDIDRLIVITDEQTHDGSIAPFAKNSYMINVGTSKNGVGYGKWIHLDGFSESVLEFISEYEKSLRLVTDSPAITKRVKPA
jgi:hypothetical protein